MPVQQPIGRAHGVLARWLALVVAPLALLMVLVPGCRRDQAGPTVDPADLLRAAADRLEQVKSFHFVLTHESGGTLILQGMLLTRAEGDVARPDQIKAQLSVQGMGAALQLQFIGIGNDAWLSNPFNPALWQRLPDVTADDVLDLEALPQVLRQVRDARLVGEEPLDGAPSYHLQGTLGSADLVALVPSGTEPGLEVTVDLWIDKDDPLLRRVVVTGALTATEPATMTRTLELSSFDEPVTIAPPQ
mgnify:CR=1 FL=1